MRKTRLVDIAREVGVSAKTVSNVVNGTGMVSDAVRERVEAAIETMEYRPNVAARALRTGRSGIIALSFPDLREPYFAEYASVFCDVARSRGVQVIVNQSKGDLDAERDFIEAVAMPPLDGLVLSPLALGARDLAQRASHVPLVLLGEHGDTLATPDAPHVGVDNVAAAQAATTFLLERGRRRIAVIGAQEGPASATAHQRLEGVGLALSARGLALDPQLVGWVEDFNREEGSRAAARLLDSGAVFDGLFCFNDTLALGALYTLGSRGRAVPDQVLVVGFDNLAEVRYSLPRFASVDTNITGSANHVLDLIRSDRAESTGGAAGGNATEDDVTGGGDAAGAAGPGGREARFLVPFTVDPHGL